jgi:hypothetical protein
MHPLDELLQTTRSKAEAERWTLIDRAVADTRNWLEDLLGQGLGQLYTEHETWIEARIKTLVDAKAPGLAKFLRPTLCGASMEELPQIFMECVAPLWLAIRAIENRENLPPEAVFDLKQLIGFSVRKDAVRAAGITLTDRWCCLGTQHWRDDNLRVRATYFQGVTSGHTVRIIDYAGPGFDHPPQPYACGHVRHMAFAAYPGQLTDRVVPLIDEPLQNLIPELEKQNRQDNIRTIFPDLEFYTFRTLRDRQAEYLALNPWFDGLAGCVAGQFAVSTDKNESHHILWQDPHLNTESICFNRELGELEALVWLYFADIGMLPVSLLGNSISSLQLNPFDVQTLNSWQ